MSNTPPDPTPPSNSPAAELDLDLHFLPAWAQRPPSESQYGKYEDRESDRSRRGGHPERREGGRRPGGRPGDRPGGPREGRPPDRRDRGPQAGPGPAGAGPRREGRPLGPRREERREPPPPPIQLNVSLIPEESGVESLARQIRLTGRAYPLFDIAQLILKKPERFHAIFSIMKNAEGQVIQPLFLCNLDESLWLDEAEAVHYILKNHFATFYQIEKIPAEPPKGIYTFVAQCGLSGVILGPPNYHDYQVKLRRLHSERFSHMPFEAYKARVKIVKDEAVVKQWLDDQSWKTEYVALNLPEPLRLLSREDVDKHFREVHVPNLIRPIESHTVAGAAAQQFPCHALRNIFRRMVEEQHRFPLKVVNVLSQQFASHGMQFFKVNRTVTHVSVARPRYLDMVLTPVSDGVRKIVEFVQATKTCTRRKLIEALAPPESLQALASPEAGQAATPPSPEVSAIVSDLHWLIHQGHVIEFSNGILELAKKPVKPEPPARPRPPKPQPAAERSLAQQPAPSPAESSVDSSQVAEAAPEISPEPPAVERTESAEQVPAAVVESAGSDAPEPAREDPVAAHPDPEPAAAPADEVSRPPTVEPITSAEEPAPEAAAANPASEPEKSSGQEPPAAS